MFFEQEAVQSHYGAEAVCSVEHKAFTPTIGPSYIPAISKSPSENS